MTIFLKISIALLLGGCQTLSSIAPPRDMLALDHDEENRRETNSNFFQLPKNAKTFLHNAVIKEKPVNFIEYLIEEDTSLLNAVDDQNKTALDYAKKNSDLYKALKSKGAQQRIDMLLWQGIEQGDRKTVASAIDQGADINTSTKDGDFPIHKTAFLGHTLIAELLIQKNANVNARNSLKQTSLQVAIMKGHISLIQLLMQKGGHLELEDIKIEPNGSIQKTTIHTEDDEKTQASTSLTRASTCPFLSVLTWKIKSL